MGVYTTGTGQRLNVHNKTQCDRRGCIIHGPSDHHMKTWPTNWREEKRGMERICPHGVGHPDPDDVAFRAKHPDYPQAIDATIHGCDGCCRPPGQVPPMAHVYAAAKEEADAQPE